MKHLASLHIWKSCWDIECALSLLVERFVPTKVINVRNKNMPGFHDDFMTTRPQAGGSSTEYS